METGRVIVGLFFRRGEGGVEEDHLQKLNRWDMVPQNVAAAVGRPKVPKKQMHFLAPEQVERFWQVAEQDRFYALYVLTATTGMRQGELLGLQWSDIDFTQATLSVQRTLRNVGSSPVVGFPTFAFMIYATPLPRCFSLRGFTPR